MRKFNAIPKVHFGLFLKDSTKRAGFALSGVLTENRVRGSLGI